jgi:CheY-like chemotaxis protein
MTIDPHARTKVMIADNDAMIRNVLRSLLTRLGLVLIAVGDADDVMRSATPDISLFLLDLDMPGGGGLAACRSLRASPVFRTVPIAILTGYDSHPQRQRCYESGATLFLTKPFNPAELLGALSPHLPLDAGASAELDRMRAADRGLRLQDTAIARTAA